ncbi:hypothetical protein B7P43_G17427 [Cryptotermes secundus]|uniref:Cuticle protein 19 n=1 Tax=Cryptotermes secundus TaxID=105785 RepID=A0A2J7PBB0_9NEOP|nr:hypothetical protein B7P43_G17427 [Cryptotermes secundus]
MLASVTLLVAVYTSLDFHAKGHNYEQPKCEFSYAVYEPHTGDVKEQWETDGDTVKGSYSLKEAGGATRTVEYHHLDKHGGFVPVVKRAGGHAKPEITYHSTKAP